MSMTDNLNIEFDIECYNEAQKSIVVKFYSPLFKRPKEDYAPLNVGLFNFNKDEDIKNTLFKLFLPTVQSIIKQEQDIDQTIINSIDLNTTFNVSLSSVLPPSLNNNIIPVNNWQNVTSALNFIN